MLRFHYSHCCACYHLMITWLWLPGTLNSRRRIVCKPKFKYKRMNSLGSILPITGSSRPSIVNFIPTFVQDSNYNLLYTNQKANFAQRKEKFEVRLEATDFHIDTNLGQWDQSRMKDLKTFFVFCDIKKWRNTSPGDSDWETLLKSSANPDRSVDSELLLSYSKQETRRVRAYLNFLDERKGKIIIVEFFI